VIDMLGLLLAVGLATVHISVGRSQWLTKIPQNLWTSFAGGISITYIFLDIFPELNEAQSEIEESGIFLVDYFRYITTVTLVYSP